MEDEKLYRNIDDDDDKYRCPDDFAPVFFQEALDSLSPQLKSDAQDVCGNDLSCLFDIAATKNIAIGQSTLSESTQIQKEIAILGKKLLHRNL